MKYELQVDITGTYPFIVEADSLQEALDIANKTIEPDPAKYIKCVKIYDVTGVYPATLTLE